MRSSSDIATMDHDLAIRSSSPLPVLFAPEHTSSYYDSQAPDTAISISPRESATETFATHRKPVIPSGSRATPIPANITMGFQQASLLPRAVGAEEEPKELHEPKKKRTATKDAAPKSRSNNTKVKGQDTETDGNETLNFKTTKPRAALRNKSKGTNGEDSNEPKKTRGRPKKDASEPKEKAPRKPRNLKKTAQVSSFFDDKEKQVEAEEQLTAIDLTSSLVTRKKTWTPPRDLRTISMGPERSSHEPSSSKVTQNLTESISKFGYEAADGASKSETTATKPTAVKRKIELIANKQTLQSKNPEPVDQAAKVSPKKRPQTITNFALEKYSIGIDTSDIAVGEKSMVPATASGIRLDPPRETADKPAKRARKDASKPKAASKKGKVTKVVKQQLASPATNARRLAKQGVLFGTSSQLAGPNSPEVLRRLQIATKESLEMSVITTVEDTSRRFRYANMATSKKSSMWASDFSSTQQKFWQNEEANEAEQNPSKLQPDGLLSQDAIGPFEQQPLQHKAASGTDKFRDIADSLPADIKPTIMSSRHQIPNDDGHVATEEWRDIDDFSFTDPSPQIAVGQDQDVVLDPPFISNEVNMVEISPGHQAADALEEALQKRPRGRPRKDKPETAAKSKKQVTSGKSKPITKSSKKKEPDKESAGEFTSIDDILDSEAEISPSPSHLRTSITNELSLTTDPLPKSRRAGTRADWDLIKAKLFNQISHTILNSTPTHDAKNPSWHERILMYDPIILEDFTTWLNAEGLKVKGATVGDEGKELLPWMVGRWCEENSICCLWKLTNRNVLRSTR